MPRVHAASATLIVAAVLAMSGCSSSDADPSPVEPVASSESAPSAAVADDPDSDPADGAEAGDTGNGDNFAPIVIEQVAKVLTPTPTYVMTSETSVEYTFPSGSATDGRQIAHCQIGIGAIGDGYDVTMTYPDGSVRCADLLN